MPRINVWIPDDLHRTVKLRLPGLNVSAVVQGALAAQLECDHDQLVCSSCSTPVDHRELTDRALSRFYDQALQELDPLIRRGGTAEGAARVLKDAALRHQITAARRLPLPRPTRANRREVQARKVTELPRETDSRANHPTARRRATA